MTAPDGAVILLKTAWLYTFPKNFDSSGEYHEIRIGKIQNFQRSVSVCRKNGTA